MEGIAHHSESSATRASDAPFTKASMSATECSLRTWGQRSAADDLGRLSERDQPAPGGCRRLTKGRRGDTSGKTGPGGPRRRSQEPLAVIAGGHDGPERRCSRTSPRRRGGGGLPVLPERGQRPERRMRYLRGASGGRQPTTHPSDPSGPTVVADGRGHPRVTEAWSTRWERLRAMRSQPSEALSGDFG